MKPDNQGELYCKSKPASGKPMKVDEWSDMAPSNSFNNSMKGRPMGNMGVYNIFDKHEVGEHFGGKSHMKEKDEPNENEG